MSCDPERVTAYVDGALGDPERRDVEAHVATCEACHDQEVFERGLRQRLMDLPPPALPPRLAQRVRARVRPRRGVPTFRLVWLSAAAGLLIGVLWARGAPEFVAWQLARDHAHCFGRERLDAQVWSGDPGEVARWIEERGHRMPIVPASAGGMELIGARFCPMLDRRVGHLYYGAKDRHLSVYVVPGPVRVDQPFESEPDEHIVHIRRTGGTTVALVSADPKAITAFRKAFERTIADAGRATGAPLAATAAVW